MAIKVIVKRFETMAHAERYQNRLYNKYDSVQLMNAPMFSEAGEYIWWCR